MDYKSINSYSGYKDTGNWSNHSFCYLFFTFKCLIGIIIEKYSYFGYFS